MGAVESSLDRFARTRGAAMLGQTAMGRSWKVQTGVGGGLLALSAVLATLPAFGVSPEVLYGVIGPTIAGTINLGLGLTFRKFARRYGPELELSEEARELLGALVVRAQAWQPARRGYPPGMRVSQHWIGHRAPAPPSAEAMAALERAASAHNRTWDALGDAKDERSLRLRAAADAGMAEALHQAATRPDALEETVVRLGELADRVEASVQSADVPTGLRARRDATLEELRAEDEARQELRG